MCFAAMISIICWRKMGIILLDQVVDIVFTWKSKGFLKHQPKRLAAKVQHEKEAWDLKNMAL